MHSIHDLCVKVNSQIQFFEKKQHSISSRPRTHQRQCTKAADGAHRRRRKPASASPFHSNGAPPNDCGRQSPAPRRNAIAAAQTAPADARHRKQEPRSRETRHESRRSKRNFRRVMNSAKRLIFQGFSAFLLSGTGTGGDFSFTGGIGVMNSAKKSKAKRSISAGRTGGPADAGGRVRLHAARRAPSVLFFPGVPAYMRPCRPPASVRTDERRPSGHTVRNRSPTRGTGNGADYAKRSPL